MTTKPQAVEFEINRLHVKSFEVSGWVGPLKDQTPKPGEGWAVRVFPTREELLVFCTEKGLDIQEPVQAIVRTQLLEWVHAVDGVTVQPIEPAQGEEG